MRSRLSAAVAGGHRKRQADRGALRHAKEERTPSRRAEEHRAVKDSRNIDCKMGALKDEFLATLAQELSNPGAAA